LTSAFGHFGQELWKTSGIVTMLLIGLSGIAFFLLFLARGREKLRAWGLLCFVGAMVGVAIGVGFGRSGLGPGQGFSSRYVTTATLMTCCIFLGWGVIGGAGARLVQMSLFTVMVCGLIANFRGGLDMARAHARHLRAFENDVQAGLPPTILAARYSTGDYPIYTCRVLRDEESLQVEFTKLMRMLKEKNFGLMRGLNDIPTTETSFPIAPPRRAKNVTWLGDGAFETTGEDPFVVFELDHPTPIIAIRVNYSVIGPPPPLKFEAYWQNESAAETFSETERYFATDLPQDPEENIVVKRSYDAATRIWMRPRPTGAVREFWLTIPIGRTIDRFRLDFDNQPATYRIKEIRFVVPADSAPHTDLKNTN
jgi:hypothetical protein